MAKECAPYQWESFVRERDTLVSFRSNSWAFPKRSVRTRSRKRVLQTAQLSSYAKWSFIFLGKLQKAGSLLPSRLLPYGRDLSSTEQTVHARTSKKTMQASALTVVPWLRNSTYNGWNKCQRDSLIPQDTFQTVPISHFFFSGGDHYSVCLSFDISVSTAAISGALASSIDILRFP